MAKYLKFQIWFALAGTVVAVSFTTSQDFQQPENGAWWEWLYYCAVIFATIGPMSSTVFFVYNLAKFSLDEDPHPDRLKSEKQELEWRLASLQRKMDDLETEQPHNGRNEHH